MQWRVGKSKCAKLAAELSAETRGKVAPIREFQVTSVTSQLHPIKKATGSWKDGSYSDYSAIAFAFAHELYRELNVPIGILNCSFSQTAIQAWVPREGYATAKDDYSKAIHQKCLQTDPTTPEHKEAWSAFYESLEDQIAASEAAIKKGEKATGIGAGVPGNLRTNRDATWLFNGRLSPVVPFAIRGAIWNQGYANMNEGLPYYNNLHSLVRGWRIVWGKPKLPVYSHQFYRAGMRHASGLAAAIGNSIAARAGRPVGILFMQTKTNVAIENWIAPGFLKDAPSLIEDYKTVGSKYFDNPYYLANVRRYIAEWKQYWGEHIPAMMQTKAVPDGSSWGRYPSPKPQVGDSTATWTYNVYVHCFTPAALSGIVFLSGESMVADDQGANFGPEISALANCFKAKVGGVIEAVSK